MKRENQLTRRQAIRLLGAAPFAMSVAMRLNAVAAPIQSPLDLKSSDMQLENAFRWAKAQALEYVFDGDPVGPWYEAALPGRHAFCMRDTAHQADGAQALGLARYNHNMLRRFAENISEKRDWCSYWEIDRLNRPAPVDYENDAHFWYNLPANYDILDACYRMYRWTGDKFYIQDPVFLNFYERTIVDYTERWSLSPDRIMQRTSNIEEPPFFRGDPTYEESSRDILVGVDLLATQYAAFRAYAKIQSIRGNSSTARRALETAAQIKTLINTTWWNAEEGYFYAFLNKQRKFLGRAGADVLYRNAAEDGPRTTGAIKTLLETIKSEPSDAVEAKSHYPEILYRYGHADDAYAVIMNLTQEGRARREYPEVSYSVIGAMVTGLMGIRAEDSSHPEQPATTSSVIVTQPAISSEMQWVELRDLPVLSGAITVRHEGNRSTTLTNQGSAQLRWRPTFTGWFKELKVDGRISPGRLLRSGDISVTASELSVGAGKSIQVSVV